MLRNRLLTVLLRINGEKLIAFLTLVLFWAISLHNLAIVPQVYEDEPWQASIAYKLAVEGVFGSDMFAGFYNTENHYYGFMPLHPLLQSLVFRFAGMGLFQARFEAVAMGLLTLVLTFALGRRLFGPWVGALAVIFLVFVRWTGFTYIQLTGIPLIDLARIARYDIVVPVFALASLHAYVSARQWNSRWLYLVSGLLAGLAGLAHLYGAFWLVALLVLTIWDGGRHTLRHPEPYLLTIGFIAAWLPYLVYVANDLTSFYGQSQIYGYEGRFDLLNPTWYWQNLVTEYKRYGPGLGPFGWPWLLRVGVWGGMIALPLSLGALAMQAIRRQDASARTLLVPLVVIALLFALLLRLKLVNYTLTLVPLATIVVAWGLVQAWRNISPGRTPAAARAAIAILVLAIIVEGGTQIVGLEAAASRTTPYGQFVDRIREQVPRKARILALHNYWFGLQEHDYRAFWVPLRWADPALVPDPVPFDVALDRVAPEFVFLDQRMRGFFDQAARPGTAGHDLALAFWKWMDQRMARLVARIEDETYGAMDVYEIERKRPAGPKGD